jgi:hypothetical protein
VLAALNCPAAKIRERIAAEGEIVGNDRASRQGRPAKGKQASVFAMVSPVQASRAKRVMTVRVAE